MGGTQIGQHNSVHDPEEAASEGWAGISSGGGFSLIQEAPDYQKTTLSKYFEVSNNASDLPYFYDGKYKDNEGLYNRNGRGIPDISASKWQSTLPYLCCASQRLTTTAVSANIAVWNRNHYTGESGTSASAPIVAALFNRIIEERIRAGKRGRIGLVNPTLYKNPQVLNDITKGNNGVCVNHNQLFFGREYGYNCTSGWDPVTGLGTPKYPELLKVFMNLP